MPNDSLSLPPSPSKDMKGGEQKWTIFQHLSFWGVWLARISAPINLISTSSFFPSHPFFFLISFFLKNLNPFDWLNFEPLV